MMKSYRKTSMSVALGVALATVALMPATSSAFSVNNNRLGGQIVTAGGGDTLLFPFYTVANGSTTSFSVTNTSDQTVAAKVRFREQLNSQDVLDFIVVLSPDDKFDFWVADNAGTPTAFWKDNSCVVGYGDNRAELKSLPLTMPLDGAGNIASGHVEVMGMLNLGGVRSGDVSLADMARHDQEGYPLNCNPVLKAFENRENVNNLKDSAGRSILTNLDGFDVGNVLIGAYVVTAGAAGIEGGDNPIVIRDSFRRAVLAAQSSEPCTGAGEFTGGNQASSGCYEVYSWDGTEEDHPHLGDINWVSRDPEDPESDNSIVANIDGALTAQALRGDWSNNPANSVGYDWVVTFPTKYVYLDTTCTGSWDFVNVGNKVPGIGLIGLPERCTTPSPFGTSGQKACTAKTLFGAYNTEEGVMTVPSPSDKLQYNFCSETQVFTYVVEDGVTPEPSLIQTPDLRQVRLYDKSLAGVRGWIQQPIAWVDNDLVPTHFANNDPGAATQGLVWIVRSTDDATVNNGSLRELDRQD